MLEQAVELTAQLWKCSVFILPNLKLYKREQAVVRLSKACTVHVTFPPMVDRRTYALDFPFYWNDKWYSAYRKRDIVFSFIDGDALRNPRYKYTFLPCNRPVNFLFFTYRHGAIIQKTPRHLERVRMAWKELRK